MSFFEKLTQAVEQSAEQKFSKQYAYEVELEKDQVELERSLSELQSEREQDIELARQLQAWHPTFEQRILVEARKPPDERLTGRSLPNHECNTHYESNPLPEHAALVPFCRTMSNWHLKRKWKGAGSGSSTADRDSLLENEICNLVEEHLQFVQSWYQVEHGYDFHIERWWKDHCGHVFYAEVRWPEHPTLESQVEAKVRCGRLQYRAGINCAATFLRVRRKFPAKVVHDFIRKFIPKYEQHLEDENASCKWKARKLAGMPSWRRPPTLSEQKSQSSVARLA